MRKEVQSLKEDLQEKREGMNNGDPRSAVAAKPMVLPQTLGREGRTPQGQAS
jgi:hypothetical protein